MFGIDISATGLPLAMPIALLAGLLSFLSPCVLPIVPPYLAFMAGMSAQELSASAARRRVLPPAIAFVLGLSTVFLLLGFTASVLGRWFVSYQTYFVWGAGGLIILFGLHFLGIFRIPLLYREARFETGASGGNLVSAYLLGLAFAFGWTPCIGPMLGGILALAAQDASLFKGLVLMATYAIGLGLPFLLAAWFIGWSVRAFARLRPWMGTVEKAMGVLLIVVGILLISGDFTRMSFWLLESFPVLGEIG